MTRLQEFDLAVKEVTKNYLRNYSIEPKKLHAEMNWNLETLGYTFDVTNHIVFAGLEDKFIEKLGMKICKKHEAMYLLVIGEKHESGCFISRKYKNYWLKIK